MQKITWEINESFIFPETYGSPVKASEVHVTPRWEQKLDEYSVALTGIYHLSAFLEFDKGKEIAKQLSNDSTLIDEVEWQDKQGYFEYAIPLDVSLPKIGVVHSSIDLKARDVNVELQDNGICKISSYIDCLYDEEAEKTEVVQPTEGKVLNEQGESVENTDSEESILSEFLWDLEEHYTTVELQLNKIRK